MLLSASADEGSRVAGWPLAPMTPRNAASSRQLIIVPGDGSPIGPIHVDRHGKPMVHPPRWDHDTERVVRWIHALPRLGSDCAVSALMTPWVWRRHIKMPRRLQPAG